jgi:hypothetical protein
MLGHLVGFQRKGIELSLDCIEVHKNEIGSVLTLENRDSLESIYEAMLTAMAQGRVPAGHPLDFPAPGRNTG